MRTLVIGIPLPHATFDNASFLSAPSLSEYTRLVVEMSSLTRVVGEVIGGSAEHKAFARQPVVNRPASGDEFSLAALLTMRRREAAAFFARGGTAVVIAYPPATIRPESRGSEPALSAKQPKGIHPDPETSTGLGAPSIANDQCLELWRSYEWLPEPRGFSYQKDLLPGFGKEGGEPVAAGHPFERYIQEFAPSFRYRACADDAAVEAAAGAVLARSAGGTAIAFDLPVEDGRVVFVPPRLDPAQDRQEAAQALLAGFDAISALKPPDVPEWIRKEVR